jgi:hypothetical protein
MKKVIEKLEAAKGGLKEAQGFLSRETIKDMLIVVSGIIDEALAELQSPRYYTPEQWEAETGEPWPDSNGVFYRYAGAHITYEGIYYDEFNHDWHIGTYKYVKGMAAEAQKWKSGRYQMICATEASPPPDEWKPEKAR